MIRWTDLCLFCWICFFRLCQCFSLQDWFQRRASQLSVVKIPVKRVLEWLVTSLRALGREEAALPLIPTLTDIPQEYSEEREVVFIFMWRHRIRAWGCVGPKVDQYYHSRETDEITGGSALWILFYIFMNRRLSQGYTTPVKLHRIVDFKVEWCF